MASIGRLLKAAGWVIWTISGIWGLVLCLSIITKAAGFWGLFAAVALAPITFLVAPLYAGFAWGNWFPLLLTYGGGLVVGILQMIGGALDRDA